MKRAKLLLGRSDPLLDGLGICDVHGGGLDLNFRVRLGDALRRGIKLVLLDICQRERSATRGDVARDDLAEALGGSRHEYDLIFQGLRVRHRW